MQRTVIRRKVAGFGANFFVMFFIFAGYPWLLQWWNIRAGPDSGKKKDFQ
ncbi:MAG TPA: hypothetical protein O0X18_05455 [Methanocorpusculum sp.]|nr:hypothetical protein [Methanocorpusculum sp.]